MAERERDMERRLIIEQRRRMVAAILNEAEDLFRDRVTEAEWQSFREKVLSSIGTYHDLVLDVLRISRDDQVRNERVLDLLERIYAKIT